MTVARFDSACPSCSRTISTGDPIRYAQGLWVHGRCADVEDRPIISTAAGPWPPVRRCPRRRRDGHPCAGWSLAWSPEPACQAHATDEEREAHRLGRARWEATGPRPQLVERIDARVISLDDERLKRRASA